MNLISGNKSKIYITCKAYKASWLPIFVSSSELIEKDLELIFTVHLPKELKQKSLKYYWQIANSGDEALAANYLRGDIVDSNGELGCLQRVQ